MAVSSAQSSNWALAHRILRIGLQRLDQIFIVALQDGAQFVIDGLLLGGERRGGGEVAAARHQPRIAQRHLLLFGAADAWLKSAPVPFCMGRAAPNSLGARSMKPSITLPISTRSVSRRLPHSPSRLISISLTIWLERSAKVLTSSSSLSASNRGWRVGLDGGLQRVHAGEQDLAHQAHIGLGDQRVVGMAGHQQGQAQRLPRAGQPVHRDHRHIGRDIGIALDQLVIDFAHLPHQRLGEGRHRAGQHPGHVFDGLARRSSSAISAASSTAMASPSAFLRRLARPAAPASALRNRIRGQRPELGGARQRLFRLVRQDQRLGIR